MSLQQWLKNGWLRPHETIRQQIADLLTIVDRDIADASTARLSSDWQFGIAYNAALKLCTVLLYAEGYRPDRALAHYRTLQALPLILGSKRKEDAVNLALKRAGKSIKNLSWFQIVETRGSIEKNQVAHWQVTIKVGFTVE